MGDIFLQLRPGTDAALINGMLYTIIAEKLYNSDFINSKTEGFEELRQVGVVFGCLRSGEQSLHLHKTDHK
jgi:anaerobic selenocysteine-containing dehydrogenase